MTTERSKQRMLRIVSKCTSRAEFVAIFARFCDATSIFIVTKTPKEIGATSRFTITLAGGEPMLMGSGEVIEAYRDNNSPLGRPGMRMRFEELDAESKKTLLALTSATTAKKPAAKPPPPPILPSIPSHIPPIPGPPKPDLAEARPVRSPPDNPDEEPVTFAGARDTPGAPPKQEQRTPGSSLVLPANPFGELTEQSLEAFIECTMYEESGVLEAVPDNGQDLDHEEVPQWWPGGDDTTSVDAAATTPDAPYPVVSPAASATFTPQPRRPAATPAHSGGSQPGMTPSATPGYAGHTGRYDPTELVPFRTPRSNLRTTLIIAGVASLLSLAIGYAVWGSDSDTASPAKTPPDKPDESAGTTAGRKSSAKTTPTPGEPTSVEPNKAPATAVGSETPKKPAAAAPDKAPDKTPDPTPDKAPDRTPDPTAKAATAPLSGDLSGSDCRLSLLTRPPGATVTLRGKRIGKTPTSVVVPCGNAPLVIRHARYAPEKRVPRLVASVQHNVSITLKRPRHTLRISSSPSGATAYVNGRRIGPTPASTKVTGYERLSVTLKRRGYATWSQKVYPSSKVHSVRGRLTPLRRRLRRRR